MISSRKRPDMPANEFFASKLASGTALASKMALWWPKHGHASIELLAACMDSRGGAREVEKSFIGISDEWELAVPVARSRRAGAEVGLMVEHALLEMDLIYAVLASNVTSIERIADRMMDNAKVQGTRYAHSIPHFPSVSFSYLIQEHVELFVGAVRSRLDRNAPAAAKCARAMDSNAVALAALTAEWF
jgi:hypothetical protein